MTQPWKDFREVQKTNVEGGGMSSDDEETEDTVFSRLELDTEDCNVRQDVNIGHLALNGSVYRHQACTYSIDVQDEPEKVRMDTLFHCVLAALAIPTSYVMSFMCLAGTQLPSLAFFAHSASLPRSSAGELAGGGKSRSRCRLPHL